MVVRASNKGNGKNNEKLWLENNFTQVPHDILEALAKTHLAPNESKVVFFIIRKTFGWNKLEDWIALSQIVEATGIAKPNVSRTLNSLKRRNIIERPDRWHMGLQLDHTLWCLNRSVTVAVTPVTSYQYR